MPSRKDLANAIRALSMDAVQKAASGHPGAPMGLADIAEVLWNDFLSHNPANPAWPNRDRFILSNGHGSMLLYSLLHLTGYDLSIDEIKNFRQLHSRTPGHPEYNRAPGIETTTGPLGQGIANAVGMALGERTLAARFNRPGYPLIDHYTYVFAGDGCLMEGISHEVCSLAGTLGLGKLIAFYDDNGISIDGEVEGWFTDDTPKRFEAYGWHVIAKVDGHDSEAIRRAIDEARSRTEIPSLICCKTIIGWGSPNKQGTESCHGAPLGENEVHLVRETIGWPHAAFEIPDAVYSAWNAKTEGENRERQWNELFGQYRLRYPDLAEEFERRLAKKLPSTWEQSTAEFIAETDAKAQKIASRKASQNCISAYAPLLPELIGGSADLAGSNLTLWPQAKNVNRDDRSGNYIFYGVREFGMAAIMNGLSLYGGFIPFGATFLTFSDYCRNALRLSALMNTRAIYVFTHDSIGLGEDGPTHQPVEHLASLRLIPNMQVWRPCDAVESAVAWKAAIENLEGPTCLVFSRQALPHQNRCAAQIQTIRRGGYILVECEGQPDAILIATGSEVGLAVRAAAVLTNQGKKIRVVSMPCTNAFDRQEREYRESILPPSVTARISIEAGSTDFWYKYVGFSGRTIGIDRFGESAPGDILFEEFNLTPEHIVATSEQIL
ncbi:MAG: transketolase [Methylococcaceae bacterium]|nr:transketolase [Methylococcaceae bacterium]MCI0667538.1 transketolase [Methylococcaceae bacterium]MCI0732877.1 transketolase [Methylococcaceae bacterium]